MNRLTLILTAGVLALGSLPAAGPGSVVFLHPDGSGVGHWYAARLMQSGPQGALHWDRLERMAIYDGSQRGWLSTSSHAGATAHAYGKKVDPDSFGMDRDQPLTAASGKNQSIMMEAMAAGIRSGIVNSGHMGEPGTAGFLASSESRRNVTSIAEQVIRSGADVIFSGGEIGLLPEGMIGIHGMPGIRTDGQNLIEFAQQNGYTVIYTRKELLALPATTPKVLGVFAAVDTYNAMPEEELLAAGLEPYDAAAPTFAEMTTKALEILASDPMKEFFLVAEEEGTDNFANNTNASGMIEATLRADAAIGEVLDFAAAHPERRILTLVAADSDAGRPAVWAPSDLDAAAPLPPSTNRGAAIDGVAGSETLPFISAPDVHGIRHPFGVAWPYSFDMQGGVLARASGYRADEMGTTISNTGIYDLMYQVLFDAE